MIEFLLGAAITISLVNLIFFVTGYLAGRETLAEKAKQIFKARRPEETSGPVKSLTPTELEKKKSHEIYEKYMG